MTVDFPNAWAIARRVEPDYHHDQCSFNVTRGAVLCDCDVLNRGSELVDL